MQYGKRVRGRKQYGGASTHIPMKVNPVGMIPLIFAQAIIAFPALLVNLFPDGPLRQSITATFGQQTGFIYWLTYLRAGGRLHFHLLGHHGRQPGPGG